MDVLDTVKQDGPRFFEKEGPWENTVGTMALQVIDGLKVGLTDPASGGIKSVLSQQQLVELARTFLAQAAKTPGMVAGEATELQAIVGGVAKAMAEDKNLLLAPDDWLAIAGVAAEAAAANPQRLFQINATTPAGAIGSEVIKDLLSVAAVDLAKGGRKGAVCCSEPPCATPSRSPCAARPATPRPPWTIRPPSKAWRKHSAISSAHIRSSTGAGSGSPSTSRSSAACFTEAPSAR